MNTLTIIAIALLSLTGIIALILGITVAFACYVGKKLQNYQMKGDYNGNE